MIGLVALGVVAVVVGIPLAFFFLLGVYGLWSMMLDYLGVI